MVYTPHYGLFQITNFISTSQQNSRKCNNLLSGATGTNLSTRLLLARCHYQNTGMCQPCFPVPTLCQLPGEILSHALRITLLLKRRENLGCRRLGSISQVFLLYHSPDVNVYVQAFLLPVEREHGKPYIGNPNVASCIFLFSSFSVKTEDRKHSRGVLLASIRPLPATICHHSINMKPSAHQTLRKVELENVFCGHRPWLYPTPQSFSHFYGRIVTTEDDKPK